MTLRTLSLLALVCACQVDPAAHPAHTLPPPLGSDLDGDGVPTPDDCFDADPTVFPGADEVPADGIDQDCDGVDVCYYDFDGDGFGEAAMAHTGDTAASPRLVRDSDLNCRNDSALTADNATDCDDSDATIFPGAEEVEGDGIDQDCDGVEACYRDDDGDGFGDVLMLVGPGACGGQGTSATGGDCDDAAAAVNPEAVETCNGIDDDCDGEVDGGAGTAWYRDLDGDGFGNPAAPLTACEAPAGYVADDTDCLDSDDRAFPGNPEVCDAVDNDCNGQADDDPSDPITWRPDEDGDGFGSADEAVVSCFMPQDGRLWLSDDGEQALDCNDLNFLLGGCARECGCSAGPSAPGAATWLVLVALGWGRRRA